MNSNGSEVICGSNTKKENLKSQNLTEVSFDSLAFFPFSNETNNFVHSSQHIACCIDVDNHPEYPLIQHGLETKLLGLFDSLINTRVFSVCGFILLTENVILNRQTLVLVFGA